MGRASEVSDKNKNTLPRELGCGTLPLALMQFLSINDPWTSYDAKWTVRQKIKSGSAGNWDAFAYVSMESQPYINQDTGEKSLSGIPYGIYARLILIKIISIAHMTNSPYVFLGKTISETERLFNIPRSTGNNGNRKRFISMLRSLFYCRIRVCVDNATIPECNVFDINTINLGFYGYISWENAKKNKLSGSWIKLDDDFFRYYVKRRGFPIDLGGLIGMSNSPLAMDLYLWITYRLNASRKRNLEISWEILRGIFGANYQKTKHFKSRVKEAFIKHLWPAWSGLKTATIFGPQKLIIKPIGPHISKTEAKNHCFYKSLNYYVIPNLADLSNCTEIVIT